MLSAGSTQSDSISLKFHLLIKILLLCNFPLQILIHYSRPITDVRKLRMLRRIVRHTAPARNKYHTGITNLRKRHGIMPRTAGHSPAGDSKPLRRLFQTVSVNRKSNETSASKDEMAGENR